MWAEAHAAGEMLTRGPSSTMGMALLHFGLKNEPKMSLVPQELGRNQAWGGRGWGEASCRWQIRKDLRLLKPGVEVGPD